VGIHRQYVKKQQKKSALAKVRYFLASCAINDAAQKS